MWLFVIFVFMHIGLILWFVRFMYTCLAISIYLFINDFIQYSYNLNLSFKTFSKLVFIYNMFDSLYVSIADIFFICFV